jgi:hypothetical protein
MDPARLIQPCPTCGRRLYIPEHLLGKHATCSHCGASFQTRCDGRCGLHPALLDRAAKLLDEAEQRLGSGNRFALALWTRSARKPDLHPLGERPHAFTAAS